MDFICWCFSGHPDFSAGLASFDAIFKKKEKEEIVLLLDIDDLI